MFRFRGFLVLLVWLLAAVKAAGEPAEVLALIHADLRDKVSPGERCYTRYLMLPVPPEHPDFFTWVVVEQGHLNGVSRRAEIAGLDPVEDKLKARKISRLARVNLLNYGISPSTWEKLAKVEPYFHDTKEFRESRYYEAGWYNGKYYPANWYYTNNISYQRATTFWSTDAAVQKQLQEVCAWTQSDAFCMWGDWFFNQTATADGRTVSYYDLLGVNNLNDFLRLIRFDEELFRGEEHFRNTNFSGISLGPRRLAKKNKLWITFDNRHDGTQNDENDPTVTVDNRRFKFVASRAFGPLPNGLPAWWLGNNKGERQVKAPDDVIGCAPGDTGNDGRLHINTKCWDCHNRTAEEQCIKNFEVLTPEKFRDYDPETIRILQGQYRREKRLLKEMETDRGYYSEAVSEVSGGWTCQKYGKAYARAWEYYENAHVDMTWAADRLMYSPQDVRAAFNSWEVNPPRDEYGRPIFLHPNLSTLLREPGKNHEITIRQWERVYPLAQRALQGYFADKAKQQLKKAG